MGLKSLVMVASGVAEDASALAAAAKLAHTFASHIEVVPAFPDPAADLVYYGATLSHPPQAAIMERVLASQRDAQARLESLVRDTAQQWGLATDPRAPGPCIEVDQRGLAPPVALAAAAALADLVVFGAGAVRGSMGALFAETLLTTRSPVFLAKSEEVSLDAVAIAWDGSLQAARAVRAALPLLERAGKALILTNTKHGEASNVDDARVIGLLKRNGVNAIDTRALTGDNVAQSLLEAARADKCGVLIAGGYGRPRMFELVLGGTTRELVRAESTPHILLAH
jgi:nucleotide-binding universal stress UspA family protein